MSNIRVKDLATTATSPAADDVAIIDGATGTRKIDAGPLGGVFDEDITTTGGNVTITGDTSDAYTAGTLKLTAGNLGTNSIQLGDVSDADIGLIQYANSDNSMRVTTNGSERLRVDSSGNVAIGGTSAARKLHVTSSGTIAQFESTSTAAYVSLKESGGNHTYLGNAGGDFVIQTADGGYSSKLVVYNGGNVNVPQGNLGISNSSPAHPLTLTANPGAANTPVAWLHNSGNVSEYDGTVISTVNDGSDVEVLHVRTNTTTYNGGSSLMLVRGDGNVGVGTASPGAGLHLEQASTDNVLAIVGQDGYNGTLFLAADGSGKDAYINVGGNRNLQIDFDTSSTPAATGTNKFTFSKLGNFTVNDGRLEVQKTGGDAILSLNRTDAKQFNVYVDSNSDLNVRDQSAGSTRLKITGSGDVNVGAGNLVIGTSGKGIDFGSGASTTLSDYERGFHNATLTPITSGTITVDSSSVRLEYTRVGDLVTISGKLAVSAVSSPVGDFVKMSLPLAVASLTESAGHFAGSCEIFNTAGTLGGYSLIGIDGEAFVRIYKNTSSGAVATAPDFSGDEIVYVGFTYHTDA